MNHQVQTIPIVIGVTGHRSIREEDVPALLAAVKEELTALRDRCPHSPLMMLNSLAEGGDHLCARAAAELGIPLMAALPMEYPEYVKDFTPQGKKRLDEYIAAAEQVFVAPPTEAVPEAPSRDFLFRQAGIYMAAHSHVLLALWDGGEGTPHACGTAEAVDFALRGSYQPAAGSALRLGTSETVIHIFTPRGKRTGEAAGTVHRLGDMEALEDMLKKTDEFNALAASSAPEKPPLLPEDRPEDPMLDRLERGYQTADTLSVGFAKIYRRTLGLLAAASTILTLAFLLYDEAEAIWMIFVCGAMLIGAWLCRRYASRSDCHRRYIEYRALAECCRVQAFLRYAGSTLQTADVFSWTQQEETAWIMNAMCALTVGPDPWKIRDIRECWVGAQEKYHRKAAAATLRKSVGSERVVSAALLLSVMLYVAALIFELAAGGELARPTLPVADPELYRTFLKIAMGSISAATLFISNYYGRLSLPRKLSDHGKMERFYAKIGEQLTLQGQTDGLLTLLAREELIENGNWCSYQRDNRPDISF